MNAHLSSRGAPEYAPHARAERLIAAGRFVLAFCSLVAVYLEPATPARHQQSAYGLLIAYTAYALVLAAVAWRQGIPPAWWRYLSHALDLVLFSLFIYFTEGPASPFFLYFVFSLFCAMLRFSWRGILATGIAAMAIYGVIAAVQWLTDPAFEESRVLVREAYLAVIAALLVYLGVYQERLRRELAALAAWPRELAPRIEDVLRAALSHAAGVLRTPKIVLIWEEREEPWVHTATWERGALRLDRRAPDEQLLAATVREELGPAPAIVVSLESETHVTTLVIPEPAAATADDFALTHIAARLVQATLEQFLFVQQVRQTASAEERLRISRELHDGIVQSLGGVGLQLQAIQSQLPAATEVSERLGRVQRVVEQDQRELRAIVRELRPHDAREGRVIVEDELRRLGERLPLEWGLDLDLDIAPELEIPSRLAHELGRIISESLYNAARHGAASRARVGLTAAGDVIRVQVSDNGRGFAFPGQSPRTLQERLSLLGGSLTIESSRNGASLTALIPVGEKVPG